MRTDRPWRRPRAARYALTRLRGFRRPPVVVDEAPDVVVDRDRPVPTRDGMTLRVNVYRPRGADPWPRTAWTPWYVNPAGLTDTPVATSGSGSFDLRRDGLTFRRTMTEDCEFTGSMPLRLW